MPLTRAKANPPLATPNGVQFFLTDRAKIVRCKITNLALKKLTRQELTVDQFERAFYTHRDRIESTASQKYDASRALYSPLTITPADLVAYRRTLQIGKPAQ